MITTPPLLVRAAMTVLAAGPTPSPSPSGDPNHLGNQPDKSFDTSTFGLVVGYVAWAVTAIAIVTLIGIGVTWVVSVHKGEQDKLDGIGRWAVGAMIASVAGKVGDAIFGFNGFAPHPQAIPGLAAVQHWINIVTTYAVGISVIGIMLTGVTAMLRHRRGEPLGEALVYVLAGCFFIASASTVSYGLLRW